jgi:hypothetical protein
MECGSKNISAIEFNKIIALLSLLNGMVRECFMDDEQCKEMEKLKFETLDIFFNLLNNKIMRI